MGAIARATYAPFATLRNIQLEFDEHGLGLVGFKVNQKPEALKGKYVIVFESPPVKMAVRVVSFDCRVRRCRGITEVMFVQVCT